MNSRPAKDQWTLITPPGSDNNVAGKEVKKFIDVLEQDHLIVENTFSVAVAKGVLYIDGDKQPDDVNKKYNSYIEKTGDFISKESKE
jgi:hypothetical protein